LEIQANAFPEPILKVERGAIEVSEGAIKGPIIDVKPEAVKFVIESGAVTVHEGAITLNLLSKEKTPWIDMTEVRKILMDLKPLEGLDQVPETIRNLVINNEKIMQSVIKAILSAIDAHNQKYADPPKKEKSSD
jgi:hypothetical protein